LRLSTTLLLASLLVSAAGCAAKTPSDGGALAFRVRPETPAPRLDVLWRAAVSSRHYFDKVPKEFARPTHVGFSDELVVGTSEGVVVKYQAANGRVRWRRRPGGTFQAAPEVADGRCWLGDLQGELIALDLDDGHEIRRKSLQSSIEGKPTEAGGRLFVSDDTDTLYAFDAATGKQLWTYRRETPEYFTIKGTCSPVVDHDAVYCGFSDGNLAAVQIDTGHELWATNLSSGHTEFVDVDEPPVVEGDTIFAASYAGGMFGLDRRTGTIRWRRDVGAISGFDVDPHGIYVASATGRIVSFGKDGTSRWSFRLIDKSPVSVDTFGPYVVATTGDGPVYVLDGATGYPQMRWAGTSGFLAPIEVGASRIYLLSNEGHLYAWKLGW